MWKKSQENLRKKTLILALAIPGAAAFAGGTGDFIKDNEKYMSTLASTTSPVCGPLAVKIFTNAGKSMEKDFERNESHFNNLGGRSTTLPRGTSFSMGSSGGSSFGSSFFKDNGF